MMNMAEWIDSTWANVEHYDDIEQWVAAAKWVEPRASARYVGVPVKEAS